jgi:hypothetical protein
MSGTLSFGTNSPDTLNGTGGNDTIFGAASLPGGIPSDINSGGGSADGDNINGLTGSDLIYGQGGNDSLFGGTDGADTLLGGDGNDALAGGPGNDSLLGGVGSDTIEGGTGGDTLFGQGGADSVFGNEGSDLLSVLGGSTAYGGDASDTISAEGDGNFLSGGDIGNNAAQSDTYIVYGDGNTVIGGNQADTVYMDSESSGNLVNLSSQTDSLVVNGGFDTISDTGNGPNRTLVFQFTGGGSNTVIGYDGNITQGDVPDPICFAEGSDILTARGEVRVETLKAGDLVATVSGQGAPMKPVLWVGRRKVKLAGNPAAALLAPVRIAAGALGDCTPHRDLLVSPDHCLFVDGALVPARLLVNGTSVTVAHDLAEVTYYHVELEGHDVLLANGAAAESWFDAGNRAWFENASVAMLQIADAPDAYATATGAKLCAPVLQGGEKVAAIRDAIALRAARDSVPSAALRRAAG